MIDPDEVLHAVLRAPCRTPGPLPDTRARRGTRLRPRPLAAHPRGPAQWTGEVVRLDVEGFFTRIGPDRVAGLMRTAGYPAAVAAVLAGLLGTSTPVSVLRGAPGEPGETRRRLLHRLARPHLPQGAPASPAVANLLAHGLDRRLAGLAAAVGARYGRYADDLVFSGDRGLPVHGLHRGPGTSRRTRASRSARTRPGSCPRTTAGGSPDSS